MKRNLVAATLLAGAALLGVATPALAVMSAK